MATRGRKPGQVVVRAPKQVRFTKQMASMSRVYMATFRDALKDGEFENALENLKQASACLTNATAMFSSYVNITLKEKSAK